VGRWVNQKLHHCTVYSNYDRPETLHIFRNESYEQHVYSWFTRVNKNIPMPIMALTLQ